MEVPLENEFLVTISLHNRWKHKEIREICSKFDIQLNHQARRRADF